MLTARDAEPPRNEAIADQAYQFDAAFREASRSAFLLARQLGRGPEEARDVVQEAALRAWRYRAGRTGNSGFVDPAWFEPPLTICSVDKGHQSAILRLPVLSASGPRQPGPSLYGTVIRKLLTYLAN